MTMYLIGDNEEPRSLESELAAHGLANFARQCQCPVGLTVYGCSPFVPGQDYAELAAALQTNTLLGIVGLTFTELSVSAPDAALRGRIGAVLDLVPDGRRYVADQQSVSWAAHYSTTMQLGGHPAWLADPHRALRCFVRYEAAEGAPAGESYCIAMGTGLAYAAALNGKPCILVADSTWGSAYNRIYAPTARWAERYGLTDCLSMDPEKTAWLEARAKRGELRVIDASVVADAKQEAARTLGSMLATYSKRQAGYVSAAPLADSVDSAQAAIVQALGFNPALALAKPDDTQADRNHEVAAPPPPPPPPPPPAFMPCGRGVPRELVVGTPFDPRTHYTPEYFGDGAGLIYTKADGTKGLYRGPARAWDGFRIAAKFLAAIVQLATGKLGSLVDLGCGFGSFVAFAKAAGFSARGVDISSDAIAGAPADVRDDLVCADVCSYPPSIFTTPVDLVTALDFWEHIYACDIPNLARAIFALLRPGGLGFFVVCVRARGEQDWTIKPGDCFSPENSWLLASGHVTMRRYGFWCDVFKECGFVIRHDLAQFFQVLRDEDPGLRTVDSWRAKNTIFVQRPR